MKKIIYICFLRVETHLMLGDVFNHTLKFVAISLDLQVGGIKNPAKRDRALAQLILGDQPSHHLNFKLKVQQ